MPEYVISTNPARNFEEIGRIQTTALSEIELAVREAKAAFPGWKSLTLEERIPFFESFISAYRDRADDIAELSSKEMGKPIRESSSEVHGKADWLSEQLDNARKMLAVNPLDQFDDYITELHHEPFGVAAVITPWNYPSAQMFVGVMQALIAGNTVVFKHSEECLLTSQLLSECMVEAGFPPGVFTTIYGDGQVGKQLLEQPIDFIHFTGSSQVGRLIYKKAAAKFIPCVLEMGGSSPGIVFDDANITNTCESVYKERFNNCGQICCALKRLFVHESIFDEVVAGITSCVENQIIGDPLDSATTIGPLASQQQLETLMEQVEDARQKGAMIKVGGKMMKGLDGAFYEPTIITKVSSDMRVFSEEVFGPVLTITPFREEQEAIELANATEYGLNAFIYSEDHERTMRVSRLLQAGQISINGYSYFSQAAPFGGYKKSGMGRSDGELGYHFVTQAKVIARPR